MYASNSKIERILKWAGRPDEAACWRSSPLQGAKRCSRPGHGVVTLARPSDATIMLVLRSSQMLDGNRQGSAMHEGGLGQGRTEALTALTDSSHGGRLPSRQCLSETPRPSPHDVETAPLRPPEADFVRRRCERAAEHIRRSAGVAHYESGNECAAVKAAPWPRLVLWVFASAALVVSLIIRAEDLDHRAAGLAVRAEATQPSSETDLPVLTSTIQAGEEAALPPSNGPDI